MPTPYLRRLLFTSALSLSAMMPGLSAAQSQAPNRMFTLLIDQYADREPRFLVDVRDVAPWAFLETALAEDNSEEAELRRELEAALDAMVLADPEAETDAAPSETAQGEPMVEEDGTLVIVAAIPTIAVPTVEVEDDELIIFGLPLPADLPVPKPLPNPEEDAITEATEAAFTDEVPESEEEVEEREEVAEAELISEESSVEASAEQTDPADEVATVAETDELSQALATAVENTVQPAVEEVVEASVDETAASASGPVADTAEIAAGSTPTEEQTSPTEPLVEAVAEETEIDPATLPPTPKDRPVVDLGYQGIPVATAEPQTEVNSDGEVEIISGNDAVALYDALSLRAEAQKGEGSSRSGRTVTVEVDDLSATFGPSSVTNTDTSDAPANGATDSGDLSPEEQWDMLMQDSLD